MIYLIRAGDTDMVKIGKAVDVEARRLELQAGSWQRLAVIRVVDAPDAAERWLHRRFMASRVLGEWFTFVPEMLTVEVPTHFEKPAKPERRPSNGFHDDLIIALGGKAKVARALGLPVARVVKWHVRGIPARYWPSVEILAAGAGLEDITGLKLAETKCADGELAEQAA